MSKMFKTLGEDEPPKKKTSSKIFDVKPVDNQMQLGLESDMSQKSFKGDSQYDNGLVWGMNQNKLRAENQPWTHEAANALGSIALNVIPEVIGNTAAILDFEDYINQDKEVGNSITRSMQELKQSVNEDVLPIYQSENSDMGTREWWMGAGRDLGTSIGGFALTGGAMGIGLNAIGKALGTVKGLSQLGKTGQALGAMIEATTLNHAEGIQSGMQVYDDVYKLKLDEYTAQGLTDAEDRARQDAADGAAYTINLNRINIPLNITSSLAFLKNPAVTRNLLKKATTMKGIQNVGLEAGQESVEEAINIVAEDAGSKRGKDKNYNLSFDDAVGSAFSDKGLQAMMLGAIGGAGNTGATSLFNKAAGKIKEENARYDNQQSEINKLNQIFDANNIPDTQAVFKNAKQTTELLSKISQADEVGKDSSHLKNQLLGQQAYNSFKYGTTGILEDNFDKLVNLTQDEALAKGLDIDKTSDNFYVKKAKEAKQKIKEFEKLYNNTSNALVNKDEVYFKKVEHKSIQEDLGKLRKKLTEVQQELNTEKYNVGLAGDLLNESDKTKSLQSYREIDQITEAIKHFEDESWVVNEELNILQSEKFQTNAKKVAKKAADEQIANDNKPPKAVNAETNIQKSNFEKAIATEDLETIQQSYETLSDELKSDPEVLAQYQSVVNATTTDSGTETISDDDSFVLPEATKINEPELVTTQPIVVKAESTTTSTKIAKSEEVEKEQGVSIKSGFGNIKSPEIVEDKKADIEKRRQEELKSADKISGLDTLVGGVNNDILNAPKQTWKEFINTKYDIELAALETSTPTESKPSKGLLAGVRFVNKGVFTTNSVNLKLDYKMAISPEILAGSEVFVKYIREEEYNGKKYPLIGVFYKKDGKLHHINNLSTVGQRADEVAQIAKIIELSKDGSYVKIKISEKKDNSTLVTGEIDYSLSDVLNNMQQNLPSRQIVLADKQGNIKDPKTFRYVSNNEALDDRISAFQYGSTIPNGSLVMYIKTPFGNVIPFVTQVKKIKEIQVNGNSLLDSLAKDLNTFATSLEDLSKEDAKIALNNFLASEITNYVDLDRVVVDSDKNVISRFKLGVNDTGLFLDYKFKTGKGVELKGRSTDIKEIIKLVGETLFNTKGENLRSTDSFGGSRSCVDYLIDNNIVTTQINVNTPFDSISFNLDMNSMQKIDNVVEEVAETKDNTAKVIEVVEEAKPVKKPSNRLTRDLDDVFNMSPDKVVSSKDIENEKKKCGTGTGI